MRAFLFGLAATLVAAGPAAADNSFPNRPVRLLVPYAAGGGTDLLARTVAQKVGAAWGQQIVIDNRTGAGGRVASEMTARAAPDGYLLLLVSAAHAINAGMYKDLPYHPIDSFTPVMLWTTAPYVMVVNAKQPEQTIPALIQRARAQPGQLTFSSSGNGSGPHLSGELFNLMADTRITHVPYKGGNPAVLSLINGETTISFVSIASARGLLEAGQIKALGVTTAESVTALPQVPPIGRAGLPGYELATWYGLLGPAGMESGLLARITAAMTEALRDPAIAEKLVSEGFEPDPRPGPAFRKMIVEDLDKYARVIRASGAQIE